MAVPSDIGFTEAGIVGPRLLVVLGGDEGSKTTQPGRFRVAGNSDVFKFIPETIQFERLKLRWQDLRQNMRPDLSRFDCVLNLVTDPDQHPKTLDAAGKLLRGYRGRVINRPEAVMRSTREQVAKRLAGIAGLRVPKVVRLRDPKPGAATTAAQRARLDFPLIVRHAGTHTGKIVGLVDGPEALDAACSGRGEFILIEFVDFRSEDGFFRKYRLWSFGQSTIFRHMVITDNWNIHIKDRMHFMIDRTELVEEEVRLLERAEGAFPKNVHDVFHGVRQRLGLDFFGMDFALDGRGDVILFEANATMSFFPLEPHPCFSYLGKILEPARKAFWTLLSPRSGDGPSHP